MQVTINANGKSIKAEITEEQAKELGLVDTRPTGYERVEKGSTYFFNDASGDADSTTEKKYIVDQDFYDSGNYYSDCEIAENNARADRLQRCLRQWQAQNDEPISVDDWENKDIEKYAIKYSYTCNKFFIDKSRLLRIPNNVYFTTKEKAEEAIEQFADELIWYFTEYVQRLDEVKNG